jgi:hypothetical protein
MDELAGEADWPQRGQQKLYLDFSQGRCQRELRPRSTRKREPIQVMQNPMRVLFRRVESDSRGSWTISAL